MPYISTKTNVSISASKRAVLEKKLGKAIELVPGKSEAWLMLSFEPDIAMCFQGKEDPAAIVEIKIYGTASDSACDAMTAAVTEILVSELDIPADRIYVKYEQCVVWGWNGANF